MLRFQGLDRVAIEDAATVVAREQAAACSYRSRLPALYTGPEHCRGALEELLADGYVGFVAHDERGCVGVMCGRTTDSVGFVPAHGLAVDPDLVDSTAVIVGLFAELAPVLLGDGADRFTIDHVDLDPLAAALNNAGFGRGGVFATQPARPTAAAIDVDVRVGTSDDLDAIAALSQIEFAYRSSPPIYAHPIPRRPDQARALHERLLEAGAVHFLARRDNRDIGLLTLEFTSPAPRLCANAQPYIGPTASHPSVRGQGIGRALVQAVLDWAYVGGHETVSVDFDSPNPLSRPFWLGLGFEPTGYRVRRTIDASYTVLAQTG
jgi:GNAT superfamily N-acetyltransferase